MTYDIESFDSHFTSVSTATESDGTSRHSKLMIILHMIMETNCNLYMTHPLGMVVTQSNKISYAKIKINQDLLTYE